MLCDINCTQLRKQAVKNGVKAGNVSQIWINCYLKYIGIIYSGRSECSNTTILNIRWVVLLWRFLDSWVSLMFVFLNLSLEWLVFKADCVFCIVHYWLQDLWHWFVPCRGGCSWLVWSLETEMIIPRPTSVQLFHLAGPQTFLHTECSVRIKKSNPIWWVSRFTLLITSQVAMKLVLRHTGPRLLLIILAAMDQNFFHQK